MGKKKAKRQPPRVFIPGEAVTIVRSSVNYAEGKTGIVEKKVTGGYAVAVRYKPKLTGGVEADLEEETRVVFCTKIIPYIPALELNAINPS